MKTICVIMFSLLMPILFCQEIIEVPVPPQDQTPALSLLQALDLADHFLKGQGFITANRFLSSAILKKEEGIGLWQLRWSPKVPTDAAPLILNVAMDGSVHWAGSKRLSAQDLQDLPMPRDTQTIESTETFWPLLRFRLAPL